MKISSMLMINIFVTIRTKDKDYCSTMLIRDVKYSNHCDLSNVVAINHNELWQSVAGIVSLQHKKCSGL